MLWLSNTEVLIDLCAAFRGLLLHAIQRKRVKDHHESCPFQSLRLVFYEPCWLGSSSCLPRWNGIDAGHTMSGLLLRTYSTAGFIIYMTCTTRPEMKCLLLHRNCSPRVACTASCHHARSIMSASKIGSSLPRKHHISLSLTNGFGIMQVSWRLAGVEGAEQQVMLAVTGHCMPLALPNHPSLDLHTAVRQSQPGRIEVSHSTRLLPEMTRWAGRPPFL